MTSFRFGVVPVVLCIFRSALFVKKKEETMTLRGGSLLSQYMYTHVTKVSEHHRPKYPLINHCGPFRIVICIHVILVGRPRRAFQGRYKGTYSTQEFCLVTQY